MGVGLCYLAGSLGVKAEGKGMALVCSEDSLFLEKGIGRTQMASFGPTMHEVLGLALLASSLDRILEAYYYALVSMPSDPEHHLTEPNYIQVEGPLTSAAYGTHSLSSLSPQQRP